MAESLVDVERRLRRTQEIAAVTGWEYDIDEDRLRFDAMFCSLFRTHEAAEAPETLDQLLRFVAPTDHRRLRETLQANDASARRIVKLACRRGDGETFSAELKLEFRPRQIGRGLIALGILQDISEQLEVEALRRRADNDALTGQPNRNRLHSLFMQADIGRRDEQDHFAFFYLDLDVFKPVNDAHGHAVGAGLWRSLKTFARPPD